MTKLASVGRGITGDTVTWTVQVTNGGPSTAVDAVLDDPTPTGLAVENVTADRGSCTEVVRCELGDLAPGATATIEIRTTITGNATQIVNVASVSSQTADPIEANDEATATLDVDNSADLAISKVTDLLGQTTLAAGSAFDYVLSVRNDGAGTADAVTVRDPLPSDFDWISTSVTGAPLDCGAGPVDGAIVCTIPQLAAGEDTEIRIRGSATNGGLYDNVATIESETRDPDAGNNQSDAPVVVTPASDLQLYKQLGSSDPVLPGETTTVTIRLVNAGPSIATGVTITDQLPPGMSFVSSDNPACTGAGTVVSCDVGTLPVGEASAFVTTVTVRIDGDATPGSPLTPIAVADGEQPDPFPDNSAGVTVIVDDPPPVDPPVVDPPEVDPPIASPPGPIAPPAPAPPALLPPVVAERRASVALRQVRSRSTVRGGQRVDLRLRVRPRGGDVARATVCTRLPRGLALVSRTGLRVSRGQVCATLTRLREGRTRTVTIRARATRTTRTQRLRVTTRVAVAGQRAVTGTTTVTVRATRARGGGVTG